MMNRNHRVASVLTLVDSEARQIAGIIGGLTCVPKSLPSAEIVLDDLLLERYTIAPSSACVGKPCGPCRFGLQLAHRSSRSSNPTGSNVLTRKQTLCSTKARRSFLPV